MIILKNKESEEKIKKILLLLDQILLNKDLYDYAIDRINDYNFDKKMKYSSTDNSIIFQNQKNGQFFSIELSPSITNVQKITFLERCFEGRSNIKKEICFIDERTISIIETEHDIFVYAKNVNQISRIAKKVQKRIYVDNQISYEEELETSVDGAMEKETSESRHKIVYILGNDAVAQESIIAEKNAFRSDFPTIKYSKTANYDVPPYDTRVCNKKCYICGMGPATKEEFEELQTKCSKKLSQLVKRF